MVFLEEKNFFKDKDREQGHNIKIINRENITLTGIMDLLSFDEELVITESTDGVLVIKGNNLHVNKLDLNNGQLEITGRMHNLSYEDNHHMSKNKTSFMSKIFK